MSTLKGLVQRVNKGCDSLLVHAGHNLPHATIKRQAVSELSPKAIVSGAFDHQMLVILYVAATASLRTNDAHTLAASPLASTRAMHSQIPGP
jgi:hypothetical protein